MIPIQFEISDRHYEMLLYCWGCFGNILKSEDDYAKKLFISKLEQQFNENPPVRR